MKRMIGVRAFVATAALAAIMFFSVSAHAQPGQCFIEFCKEAEGVVGVPFQFITFTEVNPEPVIRVLDSGECVSVQLSSGEGASTLIELPTGGWSFSGVECDVTDGLTVTPIENGAEIECQPGFIVETTCTISNVRAVSSIPTLSEWGMIAAAGGLMIVGVFFAIRKRRAFNS
ncbi:MAG: hypothetical protein AB1598_06070 [Thermodesulfobacteriota bacterium]